MYLEGLALDWISKPPFIARRDECRLQWRAVPMTAPRCLLRRVPGKPVSGSLVTTATAKPRGLTPPQREGGRTRGPPHKNRSRRVVDCGRGQITRARHNSIQTRWRSRPGILTETEGISDSLPVDRNGWPLRRLSGCAWPAVQQGRTTVRSPKSTWPRRPCTTASVTPATRCDQVRHHTFPVRRSLMQIPNIS